jgi:hypothetical protein
MNIFLARFLALSLSLSLSLLARESGLQEEESKMISSLTILLCQCIVHPPFTQLFFYANFYPTSFTLLEKAEKLFLFFLLVMK